MPRATFSPAKLVVYDLTAFPGSAPRLYRVARSDVQEDPVFEQSFRSNYELKAEPRRAEKRSAVIHMGLSMWVRKANAHDLASRMPRIGDDVAELRLREGMGVNLAETGMPYHVTVWGRPLELIESVVDIVPVAR